MKELIYLVNGNKDFIYKVLLELLMLEVSKLITIIIYKQINFK